MKWLTKLLDGLYSTIKYICIVVFGVSVLLGIAQVLSRYVFGFSFPTSEEINRFLFVWVVMLGSALVMRDKSHAAITIVVMYVPEFLSRIFRSFVYIVSVGFLGLLVYQGWKMTIITHIQPAAASGIPMSYAYFAIPTGAFFMLIFALEMCYKEFFGNSENFIGEGSS